MVVVMAAENPAVVVVDLLESKKTEKAVAVCLLTDVHSVIPPLL